MSEVLPGMSMEAVSRALSAKRAQFDFDYDSIDKRIWPDPIAQKAREHGVHPGIFDFQVAFDKVVVASIDSVQFESHEDENGNTWSTYPGSSMAVPADVVKAANSANPRGVIISAGLRAMDYLYNHGMRLGDTVSLARISPYQITIGFEPNGYKIYQAKVVEASAILCSFDLIERLKSGEVRLVYDGKDHKYAAYDTGTALSAGRQDPKHDYEEEA